MPEFFRGALVIDLDKNLGWEQAKLPMHVPVLSPFRIRAEQEIVESAMKKLAENLHNLEPFSAPVVNAKGAWSVVQHLKEAALMGLHLEAFKTMRPFIEPMDHRQVGDWHNFSVQPQTSGQVLDKDYVQINNVTFALTDTRRASPWAPAHVLELGTPTGKPSE